VSPWPLPLRPEIASLEESRITEVWELGLGRDDIIPLWVGEGDLPTPGFIGDAAVRALQEGKTFYTHKRGIPELRQAIVDYTNGLYGSAVELEQVTLTSSGMIGVALALQAILNPGEAVAVVTPIWPNILAAVKVAGGQVRQVPLDERPDGGFRLDLAKLEAALDGNTRALFVNSPGNPTGWVMPGEEVRAAFELCRRKGVWMISDEVYARFCYETPETGYIAPSFLEWATPEDPLIVVNSFSKTWAMTGWRMGWLTHPPSLGTTFNRTIEYLTSGAPNFLQYGCLAAITQGEPFVAEMVDRCRRGAELVHAALAPLESVRLALPAGGFYAFFAVEGMDDSLAGAKRLLEEAGVGLAPGSAFGPAGEGHFRLCIANSEATLKEALARLVPALGG
jgi:aspartate/methionine/tyrosine aminotransferase